MVAPQTSPLPEQAKSEVLMDFHEAFRAMAEGKKIRRADWKDKEYYGIMKDGIAVIHKPDGAFHAWIISEGDIKGIDWITN